MEVMGTQADLSDSGAERGPVKVEFTQHSLSYMDRLLIKRHRRTPIQAYQPLSSLASTHTHTLEEELTHTLTAEDVELRRYCASLFAVSSCGGSAEPEPSPGSCLSIEELDDTVGDGGFFTEQNSEDNTKQEEINVIGGPNLSHNALSQGAMLSGSPVTRSPRPALVSKAGTVQIPQPDHTTERSPRSTTGSPQPRGPETPRSSTKTPAKSTQTDRSYNLHQSTLDPSSPSPSPATPKPDLLSAGSPSSLSPSPPALHSLRSTFTLSPSSPTEPESPLLPGSPRASRFIYPSSPPVHLPDRLSPPKPLSLRSQSSPSPSEPLSSTLPYSQSPSKLLSSKSQRTKLPLNPLSSLSPGSPVSYRSPPKPLSTTSPSTPSPPDALSSRNVSTPSPEDSVSPVSSPHPLTARLSSRYVSSPSQEEPLSTRPHTTHSYTEVRSAMSPHPSPSPSLMSDPLHLPLTQSPPHSSDSLRNYGSQETPRLLSESAIRKSHSPALFPRMPATDFDMESSSDSLGMTPREEVSSDEEMKTNGCLEEWRGRAEDRCSTLLPEGSPVFLTALHPEPETGELVQEPSMALRVLAQREQTQAGSFCGLEGFLMLGLVDLSSPQPSPRPTHSHPDTQDNAHMLTTGADSWMPSSSLRACAEEHLVSTVMMNSHSQSISSHSHVATPTRRGASSGHGLYTSGRSTPRLSSRPTSAVSRPVSGTMSHPISRPLSRAAQEILDICLVDQTGCEDPDLEQDVDTRALSSLAEEFRLMATDSDLPQVSPSPGGGAETEGRVRRRGSLRLGARECHSDEEEDTLRDQQSVLSLP